LFGGHIYPATNWREEATNRKVEGGRPNVTEIKLFPSGIFHQYWGLMGQKMRGTKGLWGLMT